MVTLGITLGQLLTIYVQPDTYKLKVHLFRCSDILAEMSQAISCVGLSRVFCPVLCHHGLTISCVWLVHACEYIVWSQVTSCTSVCSDKWHSYNIKSVTSFQQQDTVASLFWLAIHTRVLFVTESWFQVVYYEIEWGLGVDFPLFPVSLLWWTVSLWAGHNSVQDIRLMAERMTCDGMKSHLLN